jgi:hypothetical protein
LRFAARRRARFDPPEKDHYFLDRLAGRRMNYATLHGAQASGFGARRQCYLRGTHASRCQRCHY